VAHPNAPLTPEGRRRLCERVDAGRAICHIAAEAGIARQTLGRWYARWTLEGEEGLQDRSSRPLHSPDQTPVEIEDRVEALRRERKVGPVQLVGTLAEEGIELAVSLELTDIVYTSGSLETGGTDDRAGALTGSGQAAGDHAPC